MAKESGLGWALSVDDSTPTLRVISNDVTDLTLSTPRGVQDDTGVDKSGKEALLLLADFIININGVFNDAALTGIHTVLKTISSTSVLRTVTNAISGQSLSCETFFTDYAVTRAADGSFTVSAPGLLGDGTVPTWS